jgi:hypothetical protein
VEYEENMASAKAGWQFDSEKRNGSIGQQLDEIEGLTDELSREHQAEMAELERKLNGEITRLQGQLERQRQEAQANESKIVEEYTTTIRQLQQQMTGQPRGVTFTDRRGSLTDNNVENDAQRRRQSLGETTISGPGRRRASLDSNVDTEAEVTLLNELLEKRSSSFPRRWQPRDCSLTTQKLYWSSDKKSGHTTIGSVDLADVTGAAALEGDDNLFILHTCRDGMERSFEFKVPNIATRDRWISAINSAIAPAKERRNSLEPTTVMTEKIAVVEPEIRVTEVIKKEEPTEGKLHKLLALI